jgi:hypothetical protein
MNHEWKSHQGPVYPACPLAQDLPAPFEGSASNFFSMVDAQATKCIPFYLKDFPYNARRHLCPGSTHSNLDGEFLPGTVDQEEEILARYREETSPHTGDTMIR